jgi:hypothetical protein
VLWPRPDDSIPAGSALRWSGPVLAGLALPLAMILPWLRRRRCGQGGGPDRIGDLCALIAVVLLLAGAGTAAAMAAASRTVIEVGGPVAGDLP